MTKPFPLQADIGAFIATTDVFDEQVLRSTNLNSEQFREFLVHLRNTINTISLLLNIKDTGYYVEQEFVCGQLFFQNPTLTAVAPASGQNPTYRQVFRKVINLDALPNNARKTVAHNINTLAIDGATNYPGFTFTRIYGAASDTTNERYIPLPYNVGDSGTAVALEVDATNIIVTTTDDKTGFDPAYAIVEYIKD